MDSRTAPELVFDQRIGDIFAVRIAGNFVNTDILGSLEYPTQVSLERFNAGFAAF
jgi:carbonic anhydrase